MDRLSFVFSLLLIVLVTSTFGSVIKAKNPTKEELEELRSDPGSSAYPEKRFKPASVQSTELIPGDELTDEKVKEFKREGSSKVEVDIDIVNESTNRWKNPTLPPYFSSGTGKGTLPYYLRNGETASYKALNDKETETGGVLTYYIEDKALTLAVMWHVNAVENQWNIRLYEGVRTPDMRMYNELLNQHPFKTSVSWKVKDLYHDLEAIGRISDSSKAKLEINVEFVGNNKDM